MKKRADKAKTAVTAADKTPKHDPRTIQWGRIEGESDDEAHARLMASPTAHAAVTMYQFHPMRSQADITTLLNEVSKQTGEIWGGNMKRAESILSSQAHSLDTIFNALAQKAAANIHSGYLPAGETYLRLALKAQSQCRTTLETLSEIKNPTGPTFVKQQNIAQNQQVNNGAAADSRRSTPPRAHEKDITPTNELLESSDGERMDTGTKSTAGRVDPKLATVGAIDRSQV